MGAPAGGGDVIELYHEWDSVCSFKVRMCLAEKGLEWRSRRVSLFRFEHLTPDYLALNPNGVVPSLKVDGRAIIESSMINEYLDETHAQPPLRPEDPVARAEMRAWVKYQDDVLYFAQRPASFQLLIKKMLSDLSREQVEAMVAAHPDPERGRHFVDWATGPVDEAVVEEARGKLRGVIERLGTRLEDREWLAGEACSLAEIAYAPFIERMERLGFQDLWSDRPGVGDWMERVKARPAFASSAPPPEFLMLGPS